MADPDGTTGLIRRLRRSTGPLGHPAWLAGHHASQFVRARPALFFAVARALRYQPDKVVTRGCEVVVEGFPRSGNTFCAVAFEMAQKRPVRMARHLHAPAQAIRGADWGIPTLVVVREPQATVSSYVVREPRHSVELALSAYNRFHRALLPHAHRFVVATFDETTKDFGAVIDRINARYGTAFHRFVHTKENVDEAFRRIEALDRADSGGQESQVARPSAQRSALTARLAAAFAAPAAAPLLEEARSLYRSFAAHAEGPPASHAKEARA